MLNGKWAKLAAVIASLPTMALSFPSPRDFNLDSSSLFPRDYISNDVDNTQQYSFSATSKPKMSRWPQGIHFAVDYYPAQWPEFLWEDDAAKMANATLSYARISEFDWAVLEPTEGNYNWDVLDRSIEILGKQGVKVILGTPTATPPIWAVDNYDILGADAQGRPRNFGSRRHYSFSSPDYRMLSKRFITAMAKRYGSNEYIVAWQSDNEYGCHSTIRTWDNNARTRHQQWLADKYNHNITLYNQMEGRVFWSSTYQSFDQINLPMLEVTESSPAGRLDFYTFSSDMAIEYAKEQVDIIRKYSDKAITTNFMGAFLDFDHFKFARETGLDLATWDSYPLGNTEQFSWIADSDKVKYGRTGTPDFQSLHHSLYRGVAGAAYNKTAGPFGIMEQQPGPVNWAPYNPSPKLGMVRLWLHEIFAHGGSMANIFRFREVPYAQEQMHAALYRRDNEPDVALIEQQQIINEDLPKMADLFKSNGAQKRCVADSAPVQSESEGQAQVALVFDYNSHWLLEAEPQSGTWTTDSESFESPSMQYFPLVFNYYTALRRLGLNVDVVGPSTSLEGYKMVVVPTMPIISKDFVQTWSSYQGTTVFGPRSASKVATLQIPDGLPPANGPVRDVLPMKVTRVETIKEGFGDMIAYNGEKYNVSGWVEWIECERDGQSSSVSASDGATYSGYRDGKPATCGNKEDDGKTTHYISAYTPVDFLVSYLGDVAGQSNVTTLLGATPSGAQTDLGTDLRFRKNGNAIWAFNYGPDEIQLPAAPEGASLILGGSNGMIGPQDVAVWSLA